MHTSWFSIERAAAGDAAARERFALRYLPVVRGHLRARWRGTPLLPELDDAVQEVFVDCLRGRGALGRAQDRGAGFRGFLYGVTRHVAQRKEAEVRRRRAREVAADSWFGACPAAGVSLASHLDREWAVTVMRAAAARQRERARAQGPAAQRRVELLRLRFQDDLPIRAIAELWQVDPAWLHHQHQQARTEFEQAWREVMGLRHAAAAVVAAKWRDLLLHFAPRRASRGLAAPLAPSGAGAAAAAAAGRR
jgi:RNA polymerase sigma-70 factor (ECF subfamily)